MEAKHTYLLLFHQYWTTLPVTWATGVLCNQDKSEWFQRNARSQAQIAQIAPKSEEEPGHVADGNLKPRFEQVSVDPPAMKNDQKEHQGRMNRSKSWRSCRHESPGSLRSPRTAAACKVAGSYRAIPWGTTARAALGQHPTRGFVPKQWG